MYVLRHWATHESPTSSKASQKWCQLLTTHHFMYIFYMMPWETHDWPSFQVYSRDLLLPGLGDCRCRPLWLGFHGASSPAPVSSFIRSMHTCLCIRSTCLRPAWAFGSPCLAAPGLSLGPQSHWALTDHRFTAWEEDCHFWGQLI